MAPVYLPRKRKQPPKIFNDNGALLCDEISDTMTFYTSTYYDTIDAVNNCIKTVFSEPGYRAWTT